MRGVQIVVSRRNDARIQLITDPLPNDTQHGANVRAWLAVGVVPAKESLDIVVRLPYDLIVRIPDYRSGTGFY